MFSTVFTFEPFLFLVGGFLSLTMKIMIIRTNRHVAAEKKNLQSAENNPKNLQSQIDIYGSLDRAELKIYIFISHSYFFLSFFVSQTLEGNAHMPIITNGFFVEKSIDIQSDLLKCNLFPSKF